MAKLSVRGVVDKERDNQDIPLGSFADAFETRPFYQASFDFQVAGRGRQELHQRDANEDEVVEIRYADGSTRWMTLGRLNQQFARSPRSGGDPVVSADSFPESSARGAVKTVVEGVGLLGIDLPDLAGPPLARWLGKHIEARFGVEEGLYAAPSSASLDPGDRIQNPDRLSKTDPNLIYIHGTASNCMGAFSALWQATRSESTGRVDSPSGRWPGDRIRQWEKLIKEHYEGRTFAFEHRSLTRSPIANAIELVKVLPEGARLHLVTHSRGGLVGELIARGNYVGKRDNAISNEEIQAYGRDGKTGRSQQMDELHALNELLMDRKPMVEKFVRVACPTSGTTLADGKLDDWLSGFASLVEKLLPIGESDIYYLIKALTLAVVKQKADASVLPGLEAMMSSSAVVRFINTGPQVEADLSVIAGDTDSGWIPWMWPVDRFFSTDQFPEGRNDLVVPTRSMNTGHRRTEGHSRTFEERGTAVNHFSYFSNRATFDRLTAGLRRKGGDAGFKPLRRGEEAKEPDSARGFFSTNEPRPRVILLPGISGSHLEYKREWIWMQYAKIILGNLTELDVKNNKHIDSNGIIRKYYRRLARFLASTHKVREFHYDWRRTLSECADELDQAVREELNDPANADQPIRIVAHSMGGLVARAWVAKHQQTWNIVRSHPDSRFIMLGTPSKGSFSIPRLLLGRDPMIRMLDKWDWRNTRLDLLKTFVRFPGILTLLPQEEDGEDDYLYLKQETWTNLKANDSPEIWQVPDQSDLNAIKADWAWLNREESIDAERMIYVAGTAPETATGITIDSDGVSFDGTSRGDGRVPWETGIPDPIKQGNKVWYMPAVHGDMCSHEPSFSAIFELLQHGSTTRLSQQPVVRRGLETHFVLPERPVRLFPDEDMLLAAAMGASDETAADYRADDVSEPVVRIGIVHGDLHHESERPIVVGHYMDDAIVNAERALDDKLRGKLSELRELGVYPGRIGTSEIVLEGKTGGIVVGLGVVGQLNPGTLKRTIRDALIRYALRIIERDRSNYDLSKAAHLAIPITSLLVGSGTGGVSEQQSIGCLLEAVQQANRLLRQREMGAITDIQLIDLFEDSAISAARCLQRMSYDAAWKDKVVFDCEVKSRAGGWRRTAFVEPPGWARRVQILSTSDGSLVYSTPTERARIDVNVQRSQRRLIDGYVRRACQLTGRDRKLEKTLYQLLVPNRLKDQFLQPELTVLMLDQETARYPWEMLDDGGEDSRSGNNEPRSVQCTLIRQLSTSDYRERPKSTERPSVLVIGDPPSRFPELIGAQQEARAVTEKFHRAEASFDVTSRIREEATPWNAIQDLFAGYRVVHLSGHGVYEYSPEDSEQSCSQGRMQPVTGMVLGDDIFLTPVEVEQMMEVPELVFINCCLLGRIESEAVERDEWPLLFENRGTVAANLATQFIKMGTRCVVAAGWEVEDNAAQTFACEFYDALFEGSTFSEAVRRARRAAFHDHDSTNTWGAYQCYGDPEYRLVRSSDSSPGPFERDYVSLSEPEIEVENIAAASAKETDLQRRRDLLNQLESIRAKVEREKKNKPSALLCAFGKAYSQLDEFTLAIEHYTEAIKSSDSSVPFEAVEQRANLNVRFAESQVPESKSDTARRQARKAIEAIESAIDQIERLNQFQETEERYSIVGSAYKRIAIVIKKVQRKDVLPYLTRCKEAYQQAANRSEAGQSHYPLLNVLASEIVEGWQREQKLAELELTSTMQEIRKQLDTHVPTNFWERSYRADLCLYEHLVADDLDKEMEEVIRKYKELRRYGSAREFASVIDQIRFLQYFAPRPVAESLEQLQTALQPGLED